MNIDNIDEVILNRKIYDGIGIENLEFQRLTRSNYQRTRAKVLGKSFDAHVVNHHVAHLAGAYYCSPYDTASVLSLDAGGDSFNHGMALGEGNNLKIIDLSFGTCLGWWWEKLPSLVTNLSDGPGNGWL